MVVGMAQALLKQRGMPTVFWGEAVVTAVYILNRSPTKALNGKTPYEAWHGRKPAVSHLRVFGCLAFVKELSHIGKLDDRSTPGVFIGYAEGSKAYRILDPGTQRVRTARDVVFDEGRGWAWDKAVDDGSTSTYNDFIVEYVHFKGAGGVGSSSSPSMPTPIPELPPTLAPRLRLQGVLCQHHHSRQLRALQLRRPLLRARPLRHQLVSTMSWWSLLLRCLTTRSASTCTTTASRCGIVR